MNDTELYDRPTRASTRLKRFSFCPEALLADLKKVEAAAAWQKRPIGDNWGRIELVTNDQRHPVFDQCPTFLEVSRCFQARVLDLSLARLGPGGSVKEHRDISGGVPMGAVRFHIPIVTHPEVQFFVDGKRLYLAPGEVWNLDTTYRHRLVNASDVWRVHLIVDFEINDHLRQLLPQRDMWDACHSAYFWLLCCGKGLQTLRHPRQLGQRMVQMWQLRVLRKSTLS